MQRAKESMLWFEDLRINVYPDHTPGSPDLNQIKYIWVFMKHRLNVMHLNIVTMAEAPDTMKTQLAKLLAHVYNKINRDLF